MGGDSPHATPALCSSAAARTLARVLRSTMTILWACGTGESWTTCLRVEAKDGLRTAERPWYQVA